MVQGQTHMPCADKNPSSVPNTQCLASIWLCTAGLRFNLTPVVVPWAMNDKTPIPKHGRKDLLLKSPNIGIMPNAISFPLNFSLNNPTQGSGSKPHSLRTAHRRQGRAQSHPNRAHRRPGRAQRPPSRARRPPGRAQRLGRAQNH